MLTPRFTRWNARNSNKPSVTTLLFFSPPPIIKPVVIQEFEIVIEFRPISLGFRELGFERSFTLTVKDSSAEKANKKAIAKFRKVYSAERAEIVAVICE